MNKGFKTQTPDDQGVIAPVDSGNLATPFSLVVAVATTLAFSRADVSEQAAPATGRACASLTITRKAAAPAGDC